MSDSAASSSPSSEVTEKPHPYQCEKKPGAPRGAYEVRRVKRGLLIRVDMPGVLNDGVKVVKYNATRTVTFSGKAPPPRWPEFESESETRVYGGYVVVDRDLADVEFESHCKNGCLRLFFPRCDGSLHFLSPPIYNPVPPFYVVASTGEEMVCPSFITIIIHDPDQSASGRIMLGGGSPEDINPYQLSGVRGVYEHKVVNVEGGDQLIYIRLDVPDTCEKSSAILDNMYRNRGVVFGACALKNEYYSRFDEAAREYSGTIMPNCKCCTYSLVRFENENGVLRLLVCKSDNNSDPSPALHCRMIPPAQGKLVQPSTLEMIEHVAGTTKIEPTHRCHCSQPVCKNSDRNPAPCRMTPSREYVDLQPSTLHILEHYRATWAFELRHRNFQQAIRKN